MSAEQVVYVVDDDDAVRSSICMLLESYRIAARPYASGTAFLADLSPKQGCFARRRGDAGHEWP
jgi:FixJ family two-component response regulator